MIEDIIRIANSLKTRSDYFNDIEGAMIKFDAVFRELKREFEYTLKDIRDSPLYFTYTSGGSSMDNKPIQISLNERLVDTGRMTGTISLNSSDDKAQSCSEKLQLEEAIKIIVTLPSNLNLITQEDLFEMDLLLREHNIIGEENQQARVEHTYIPLSNTNTRRRACWIFLLVTFLLTTMACLAVYKFVLSPGASPSPKVVN